MSANWAEARAWVGVAKPGVQTTVQDLGRWGWQRLGVVVGGCLDPMAARIANALVGNPPDAAVFEFAQVGPDLRFSQDTLVAWCGADFPARVEGDLCPSKHTVRVAAGETLSFGFAPTGWRGWLAIAGGLDVPRLLGSRGTYRRAGFGGHHGRALQAEDVLPVGVASPWARQVLARLERKGLRAGPWRLEPRALGRPAPPGRVRYLRGPEWDWYTAEAWQHWATAEWEATKDADRMGLKLEGPLLELRESRELISAGVSAGVVQVPGNGQPLVLLASRQTVGGYPRLAAIATVDLGVFAQLRPGDSIRFEEISLAAAHELTWAREAHFAVAREGLAALAQ